MRVEEAMIDDEPQLRPPRSNRPKILHIAVSEDRLRDLLRNHIDRFNLVQGRIADSPAVDCKRTDDGPLSPIDWS